jgi:intein/homing endonuclease
MAKLPKYVFDDMKSIFVDECFHPDTNIMTPDGYVKISDIREGDLVINYNEKTKLFKEDVVVDIYKNMIKSSNDKMIELIFDNNSVIKVTENHKFLTTVGWIKAIDLNETHDVINTGTYNYSMSFINETKNEEV